MNKRLLSWVLIPLLGFGAVWGGEMEEAIAQESVSDKKAEALQLLKDNIQLLKNQNYKDALANFQRVLDIVRITGDRQVEGLVLIGIGSTQHYLGEYQKSLDAFQQALKIAKEVSNHNSEAVSLDGIGRVYYSFGEYQQSLKKYHQALTIFREVRNQSGEGTTLSNIGAVYDRLGNYTKALETYEQSILVIRKTGNRSGEGRVLNGIGSVYDNMGQYSKALDAYNRSLIISREIGDRSSEGTTLNATGKIYHDIGQYTKALDIYRESLLIAREVKNRLGEGAVFSGLGSSYYSLGQYKNALEFHQKSLIISREIKNKFGEGVSLYNLGLTYYSLNKYAKALELLQESLLIRRVLGDQFGEGITLNNIGLIYKEMKKDSEALETFQKALVIAKKIKNRPGEGAALQNIGLIHSRLNQYTKGFDALSQSLFITRELGDRSGEGTILNNIGFILLGGQQFSVSEQSFFRAIDIWESLRSGLTDQNKISLSDVQKVTYWGLQQALIAQHKDYRALEISDRSRATAFVELLAARLAGESIENAIAKLKVEKLSSSQIQQVAKTQNSTLIQYSIISEEDIYIYIITPDGKITFRQTDLKQLNRSLTDFVNSSRNAIGVRGREADINVALTPEKERELQEQRDRSLRQLHQLLIEPIADLLPKDPNQRVVFMPQGELFLVPFPALLNAQNQPLITQHTILTAPSIQTLDLTHKTAQSRPKTDRPALVVGNPTMPSISTVIGDPPRQLSKLPGSEKEAIAIAKQLNTEAITGANATKDTIVQKMQNAGIIHFATHGLLDSFKGDTPGAIALAPNGTNQTNDGLLTSGELFDLKLNADLVVLSACDTARGDITGDGVIGLSRSLFVAGVPSVIASLWKVPDESTALLMTEFYRNWKDLKLDKAQALRQAMLTTREKYPEPLYWAAFTLMGEAE